MDFNPDSSDSDSKEESELTTTQKKNDKKEESSDRKETCRALGGFFGLVCYPFVCGPLDMLWNCATCCCNTTPFPMGQTMNHVIAGDDYYHMERDTSAYDSGDCCPTCEDMNNLFGKDCATVCGGMVAGAVCAVPALCYFGIYQPAKKCCTPIKERAKGYRTVKSSHKDAHEMDTEMARESTADSTGSQQYGMK